VGGRGAYTCANIKTPKTHNCTLINSTNYHNYSK
jgi:hypothetical protein